MKKHAQAGMFWGTIRVAHRTTWPSGHAGRALLTATPSRGTAAPHHSRRVGTGWAAKGATPGTGPRGLGDKKPAPQGAQPTIPEHPHHREPEPSSKRHHSLPDELRARRKLDLLIKKRTNSW